MVAAGKSICSQSVVMPQNLIIIQKLSTSDWELSLRKVHRWIGPKMFELGLVKFWFGITDFGWVTNVGLTSVWELWDNWYHTTGTLSLKSAVTQIYRYALDP